MERPINFRQLEAFRAVMQYGSMTRAGQALAVSQPAVTRLIKDLEYELGLQLFRRNGAQIVPTAEAGQLYREVERHFAGAYRIREAARAIKDSRAGYLHVGAMSNLSQSVVPAALGIFVERHPGVVVAVHPEQSIGLIEAIAHRQLDVAYAMVPEDRGDIDHELFPASHAVCAMPRGHALASRRTVALRDLQGQDFISLGARSVLRAQINAALQKADVRPTLRLETMHSHTVVDYVRQGVGLAIIDPFAAMEPASRDIVVRPFTPKISLKFSAVYREGEERSPFALAFTEIMREVVDRLLGDLQDRLREKP